MLFKKGQLNRGEMVGRPCDGSRVDLEGSHFPVGHALNLRPDEARV